VAAEQPPFAQPRRGIPPTPLVSDDELDSIHQASLRVLAETGIDILHDEARRMLAAAGARVEEARVRFDPEMVVEAIEQIPSEFVLYGRTPERDLRVGGDWLFFSAVASAPNYVDLDGIRHTGSRAACQDFFRLGQMLTSVHTFSGYPVEPVDLHPSIRHLEAAYDAHTLTDRTFHVYSLGAQRNIDGIEMARIVRGIDDETLEREPSVISVINASSPLRYDHPMVEGILQMARRGQVSVITPFTLAGAMAPITLAGALVQQNAEALAGLVLTQLARPGSPAIYGGFTSNVDMRSGAPAFGTPEYAKASIVGGQLARRYGIPYRSSAVSTSNTVDAQAGYETVWALWGAIMGGANFLMHGAGWMEGGLQASMEKMVVDADLLHMVNAFLEPLEMSDDALAVEAISKVGPGGHYFGESHTRSRYASEFYGPMVSDWRNWETWVEAGRPDARTRANAIARELLADYEPPPLDEAIVAELRDYVDRRISEGGVETDY
jgi:trimethylamine--corrinoid protein Co-methyltransferase